MLIHHPDIHQLEGPAAAVHQRQLLLDCRAQEPDTEGALFRVGLESGCNVMWGPWACKTAQVHVALQCQKNWAGWQKNEMQLPAYL